MGNTLKVKDLIALLQNMNPRSEVFWYTGFGELRPLNEEDVYERYVPEAGTKTAVRIGCTLYGTEDQRPGGSPR